MNKDRFTINESEEMAYAVFQHACFSHHKEIVDLLNTDLNILDLDRHPWTFTRGFKLARDYYGRHNDENILVATIYFEYIRADDNDPSSRLTGVRKKIDFYLFDKDEEGNQIVGATKDITKEYLAKDLKGIERAARQGQMDYMESFGEMVPAMKPYLDSLFTYFDADIRTYIERGTSSLNDRIMQMATSASDDPAYQQIQGILHAPTRDPATDPLWDEDFILTTGNAIVFQITGKYVQEYMTAGQNISDYKSY